jgi:hypothetical protein
MQVDAGDVGTQSQLDSDLMGVPIELSDDVVAGQEPGGPPGYCDSVCENGLPVLV